MAKKKTTKTTKKKRRTPSPAVTEGDRLAVPKTYKLYVNGAFPRSESGRILPQQDARGRVFANYARASRKDLRDAIRAARKAQDPWAARSPFNRSQILFRMAEMLEDRRRVFEERLAALCGWSTDEAASDVDAAVDRLFRYAGWCDKFAQILGGSNPVAAPYFNFTVPEPTGVVVAFPSLVSPLVGLVSAIAPVIVPGNTCVAVVDGVAPALAIDLAEVFATSDLPGGVVNLLTGMRSELLEIAAGHMDVNAIALSGGDTGVRAAIQTLAAENVKRVRFEDDPPARQWRDVSMESPYRIEAFVEWKTCWHPIGV
jgi:acyl-CoA reductase-like NAD-dependent aldehyde dehydrogenase